MEGGISSAATDLSGTRDDRSGRAFNPIAVPTPALSELGHLQKLAECDCKTAIEYVSIDLLYLLDNSE